MDQSETPYSVVCKLCGDIFILPEEGVEGNLPRSLLCGHIYCTHCLYSNECDRVIKCPECKVESTLSEMGVFGLQEDSRIIGLIYTAKIKRMKSSQRESSTFCKRIKSEIDNNPAEVTTESVHVEVNEKIVDEALIRAAENLAHLEFINEKLTTLSEQERKERVQLEMEIELACAKAVLAVQEWKEIQLNKIKESAFNSNVARSKVQEKIKTVEVAIQKAREICRVPFLKQYCTLDKVLETLQAPVDNQLIDDKCFTGPKWSCVFNSELRDQSLTVSLGIEVYTNKDSSLSINRELCSFNHNFQWKSAVCMNKPHCTMISNSQKVAQQNPGASSKTSSPINKTLKKISHSYQSTPSPSADLDVIIEDIMEGEDNVFPQIDPELGENRLNRDEKGWIPKPVNQWVMVTYIVNPTHFYIQYVTEQKKRNTISKKIEHICSIESGYFTSREAVETGSLVLAQYEDGLWSRAIVVKILQSGRSEAVEKCHITDLHTLEVFFQDYGPTKKITLPGKEESTIKAKLKVLNHELRKLSKAADVELGYFAPQAIRCSLKDLVPYDLTKGWTDEARIEFDKMVCGAVVEMTLLDQNEDSLVVDLKKAPTDQSCDMVISVREYLVFIEVARFYSPVAFDKRPFSYAPPIPPEVNTMCDAVVSHVNSPSDFYIQLVNDMDFFLLSAKLQEFYSATSASHEDELTISRPMIGGLCVARFDDNLWYRAQVLGLLDERVEVLYVDFGNKKDLPVCDLRKIKDEFLALPTMAIHCCMSDVIPFDGETWSEACTHRFISLSHQKLVSVMATARTEPLPLQVFKSDAKESQTNIADLLVDESLARFKNGLTATCNNDITEWDPPLELSLPEEVASDHVILAEQEEIMLELEPQLSLLHHQKNLNVRVTHVNSPSSFYVQFTQFDAQLKRICHLVKECAQSDSQSIEWKGGMYCAAKVNGIWERGQLCSDVQTSSHMAEVRRCDYGNTVKVPISQLQPLPSSLAGCMALECFLYDIRPAGGRTTWTDTACDVLSDYLTQALAVLSFKELTEKRPVPITLVCSNTTGQLISMSDFMMGEGLALRDTKSRGAAIPDLPKIAESSAGSNSPSVEMKGNPNGSGASVTSQLTPHISSQIPPKVTPRFTMPARMVKTSLYKPPELPELGQVQMKVSAVESNGMIYVRTLTAEDQLKCLQQKIHKSMKTLPKHKQYNWKSVLGCAVFGSDMLWYRGQLQEMLGGHVKVQYVDCGLTENIPLVHVYPVMLCSDIPQLALPCQLCDFHPVGGMWQSDAVALMREMLVDRSVEMLVKELPSDPRGPLRGEMFLDGLSLSCILSHHQHGFMDRAMSPEKGEAQMFSSPMQKDWDITTEGLIELEEPMMKSYCNPILPQMGESFRVRVTHLYTPNELFLWPLEGMAYVSNRKTLEKHLARINSDINSLPHLSSFPRGAPCLAEYSDGKHYRARLIDFVSVEPAKLLVQHVDFGSEETLDTNHLHQIPPELLEIPCQALKVKVAGFKARRVSGEEEMLPYSPQWSMKAMAEMLNLLHNKITATVVALEPQLTVLLWNEQGELVHYPLVSMGLAELE